MADPACERPLTLPNVGGAQLDVYIAAADEDQSRAHSQGRSVRGRRRSAKSDGGRRGAQAARDTKFKHRGPPV